MAYNKGVLNNMNVLFLSHYSVASSAPLEKKIESEEGIIAV